jgi:hypothetical protein
MAHRKRYRKKTDKGVVAVQLNLDTEGFAFKKWGAEQRCKPGDWLVDNAGDTYTVDAEVFVRTYRNVSPGIYVKSTPVWAEIATRAGFVPTKEGKSHYRPGDYLVFNNENGSDGYCVSPEKFLTMYELDE